MTAPNRAPGVRPPFAKRDPNAPPTPPKRAKLSKKGHMTGRRSLGTFEHTAADGVTYQMSIQAPDKPKSPGKSHRDFDRFMKKIAEAVAKPRGVAALGSSVVLHALPLPPKPAE